jgi:hypothetical protein
VSDELTYIGNRYGQLAVLLIAVPVGASGAWLVLHHSVWAGALFLVVAALMAAVALPVVISSLSDILSELVDWRTRFGPPR